MGFNMASTEILEKEGGSEWQEVASLPSARSGVRGLGLDHGRFMVTGECWTLLYHSILTHDTLQVAGLKVAGLTRCSCTTLKMTSGLKWVRCPQPAAGTP